MPRRTYFQMPNGMRWGIETDSDYTPSATFIIPVAGLDSLSVEQIGNYVQLLFPSAQISLAEHLAADVIEYIDDECWNPNIEMCNEWLVLLEELEYESENIAESILRLKEAKDELIRKEEEEAEKLAAKKLRSKVNFSRFASPEIQEVNTLLIYSASEILKCPNCGNEIVKNELFSRSADKKGLVEGIRYIWCQTCKPIKNPDDDLPSAR